MKLDTDKLAAYCFWGGICCAVLMTVAFWGSWFLIIFAWVMAFPIALMLGLVVGFVGSAIGFTIEKPDAKIWAEDTAELVAETSTEIVGLFQGAQIFEWVKLKKPDGSGFEKCWYDRTINLDHQNFQFEPPAGVWFCVIPPGILYVARPENGEPEQLK